MNKHIHFIGICGVAMSAIALAFHKKGWKVTGSDKGFYPPVSTYLKDAGIEYYPGWHVDKLTKYGDPDLVVVGNVAGSHNPELLYVQEHNIPHRSYPEIIAEFMCAEDNVVCAGTYGKTTTAALLAWIMTDEGRHLDYASYMFGGISRNGLDAAHISNYEPGCNLGIFEGDEYKTSRADTKAKFFHYKPTFVLLTAIEWDHADVYKTKADYLNAFKELVALPPEDGMVVACTDNENVKATIAGIQTKVITYGKRADADYIYSHLTQDERGIHFDIEHAGKTHRITSPLIGAFMAENITGAFAFAHQIGTSPKAIIRAVASFTGLKRRLEKRYVGEITVFDDIAHSPAKAASVLKNLRAIYSKKIIAVFEPNTGNRRAESMPQYDQAFADADEVIIPRLTKLKADPTDPDKPMDGKKLTEVISKTHASAHYIEDDEQLIGYLLKTTKKEDVIVFLGSHGFRGMIEALCSRLS